MKNFTIYFVLPFLAYWIAVQLIDTFVMMEFTPFTEWEPMSRGLNLAASIYVSGMAYSFKRVVV